MTFDTLLQAGITVLPHEPLSKHTTFRLGGNCKALLLCRNASEVTLAVSFLRAEKTPFVLLLGIL